MGKFDLPEERLATTDEKGNRVFLYPADVEGRYKKLRIRVHFILMILFLIAPWIKLNGSQLILLDVVNRKFALFGLQFWAHDAPMLVLVASSIALLIAFVTSLWGRIWCGWACPETVFTEFVYRKIERWIEGDSIERKKRDSGPMNSEKLFIKIKKWSAFFVVTLIITHSFLAYFIGSDRLLEMMSHSPSNNFTPFLIIIFSTVILLFAFGWFREQFCIVACPYGRIQSLLMDDQSLAVFYDASRGEPRRGIAKDKESQGDCINCYRCVQVCPTGVDIRRGVQMECIACTACIDACDTVMEKINKPKGLIRYDSEANLNKQKKKTLFRPFIFASAFLLTSSLLTYLILTRENIAATVLKPKGTPYQVIQSADEGALVVNQFKLHITNQSFKDQSIVLQLITPQNKNDIQHLVFANQGFLLPAGTDAKESFFIKAPQEWFQEGIFTGSLKIQNKEGMTLSTQEIKLVGPH